MPATVKPDILIMKTASEHLHAPSDRKHEFLAPDLPRCTLSGNGEVGYKIAHRNIRKTLNDLTKHFRNSTAPLQWLIEHIDLPTGIGSPRCLP